MGMGRVSHDVAAKWRATRWWGVDIGDAEVVLWGSPIEIGKQDRIKAVRDRLFRSHLLPAFQMSDPQMDRYLDDIAAAAARRCCSAMRRRWRCWRAHAERARPRHARLRGTRWRSRPARRCIRRSARSSSACSAPRSRMAMARATRASSRTSARRARCTCRPSTSSSNWWTRTGGPWRRARQGEIVVTHLATGDFPFIRYRTGDMAVMGTEPCACGRGLPVLREGVRAHDRLRPHGVGQRDARAGADLRSARQARRAGLQVHPGAGPVARPAARRRAGTHGRGRERASGRASSGAWARARC